jgi:hypothetical protein
MKKLIFTFGKPEGSWNAALPIGPGQVSPLVSQLLKRPQSFIDIDEVPLFSLMGERSWDDEYSFKGRLLGNIKVPSSGSDDFKHFIKWVTYQNFVLDLTRVPEPEPIIISQTIKKILEKFRLLETQFIPIQIAHELTKEKRDYYILNAIQDHDVHYRKMNWLAMEWSYVKNETKEVIAEYKKGSIDSAETYWKELNKLRPKEIIEIMKYQVIIPRYFYKEGYDALRYGGGFIFTKEIADLIIQEAGLMAVVPFDKEEILTGSLE